MFRHWYEKMEESQKDEEKWDVRNKIVYVGGNNKSYAMSFKVDQDEWTVVDNCYSEVVLS